MGKQMISDLSGIVLGSITAVSVGSLLFQAAVAFVLGILGAAGGYLFSRYLKNWWEKKFPIDPDKKA